MLHKILESLKINSFDTYWINYGGFEEIYKSAYFKISIILSIILSIFGNTSCWFDLPLSILPNILGFSIGAYAILLALGNSNFWKILSQKENNNPKTPFMEINASFVHFIFIQILAIIFALIAKFLIFKSIIFVFLGLFLMIYAILSALASTLVILKLAQWYQDYLNKIKDNIND
jgi:hypothetical protein